MLVKIFVYLFFPFFVLDRYLSNLKVIFKIRVGIYSLLGANIAQSVKIESSVDILGVKNINIASGVFIGKRCRLIAYNEEIFIGNNTLIAANTTILTRSHIYNDINVLIKDQGYINKKVIIEDDVWVGVNSVILAGVKIGKGAIIAANSVVSKNVEPYTIVGGIPAKFIKNRV